MPEDTLEQVRLLSNLESNRHKLLQIVLFGQPELDAHARQDRAAPAARPHHPLASACGRSPRAEVAKYISFRMRAAGYRGPDVFTPRAHRADRARLAAASRGASTSSPTSRCSPPTPRTRTPSPSGRCARRSPTRSSRRRRRASCRAPPLIAAAALIAGVAIGALSLGLGLRIEADASRAVAASKPPAAGAVAAPAVVAAAPSADEEDDEEQSSSSTRRPPLEWPPTHLAPSAGAPAERLLGRRAEAARRAPRRDASRCSRARRGRAATRSSCTPPTTATRRASSASCARARPRAAERRVRHPAGRGNNAAAPGACASCWGAMTAREAGARAPRAGCRRSTSTRSRLSPRTFAELRQAPLVKPENVSATGAYAGFLMPVACYA